LIGGVGGGIVQPNTMATIQAIAPDHARGGVTSAYLSVSYLALSIPVVIAGLAASGIGLDDRRRLVPRGHGDRRDGRGGCLLGDCPTA
jgi:hypothetical protein